MERAKSPTPLARIRDAFATSQRNPRAPVIAGSLLKDQGREPNDPGLVNDHITLIDLKKKNVPRKKGAPARRRPPSSRIEWKRLKQSTQCTHDVLRKKRTQAVPTDNVSLRPFLRECLQQDAVFWTFFIAKRISSPMRAKKKTYFK